MTKAHLVFCSLKHDLRNSFTSLCFSAGSGEFLLIWAFSDKMSFDTAVIVIGHFLGGVASIVVSRRQSKGVLFMVVMSIGPGCMPA